MKLYKTGAMESLRKWFYKPKRDDRSLLAQFFFADDALNMIAAELDSFDGRKDPERCSTLVTQLRNAQDRVLNITTQIMDQLLGSERVPRGFRVKFPEDVLQDNLAGQLWFGAECLAAGSSIMNREEESAAMRPLAKALTRSLETVRALLREHCLRNNQYNGQLIVNDSDDILHESLKIFDRLFAEFELCYVSAMVPVKSPQEFEAQQLICVLFSETLQRSLKFGMLTQDQVDDYDPALMFAIPRMAIVSGLLIYSSGPLSIIKPPDQMSDMFRPFRTLLYKIRELLWTLDKKELVILEKLLCTNEDISKISTTAVVNTDSAFYPDINEFMTKFSNDYYPSKELVGCCWRTIEQPASGVAGSTSMENQLNESDYLPDNMEVFTPILDGMRRLGEIGTTTQPPPQMTVPKSKRKKRNRGVLPENEDHDICIDRGKEGIDSSDGHAFHWMSSVPESVPDSPSTSAERRQNPALTVFDPLAASTSYGHASNDNNVILPDQSLVTSLSEQVSEIVDKLSTISYDIGEVTSANIQDQPASQMHSYSTNDVSKISDAGDLTDAAMTQMATAPSTSHGFLIPNAISQEPAILASLSHNNSTIFEEEIMNPSNNLRNQAVTDVIETEISSVNEDLSSLLLTREEYANGHDETSIETKTDRKDRDRATFAVGYDSDTVETLTPGDSGVCTENTSLDRSPDSEHGKDLTNSGSKKKSNVNCEDDKVTTDNRVTIEISTVRLEYKENTCDSYRNEAGASGSSGFERGDTVVNSVRVDNRSDDGGNSKCDINVSDNRVNRVSVVRESVQGNSGREEAPRKKDAVKRKKKASKTKSWSPGRVILANHSNAEQRNCVRLNLDQFVEDAVAGSCSSSATSSFHSECADDEEIAMALQAQELAARYHTRAKFISSEDLIHRLFVCIAGVADQLQTNFAADLRNILKSVFLMNQTQEEVEEEEEEPEKTNEADTNKTSVQYEVSGSEVIGTGGSFDSIYSAEEVHPDGSPDRDVRHLSTAESIADDQSNAELNGVTLIGPEAKCSQDEEEVFEEAHSHGGRSTSLGKLEQERRRRDRGVRSQSVNHIGEEGLRQPSAVERAPDWVPDIAAPDCMRCAAHFTAFRRRHHCRNCGKVFCASCSANSIPLPRFGQLKPVRVCEECFRIQARKHRHHHHR